MFRSYLYAETLRRQSLQKSPHSTDLRHGTAQPATKQLSLVACDGSLVARRQRCFGEKDCMVLQHEVRGLDVWIVSDSRQLDDVALADEFTIPCHHVRAGDRIGSAIDHREGAAGVLQRVHPPISMLETVGHIMNQLMS